MTPSEKLRIMIVRDVLGFIAITTFFFLPTPWSYLAGALLVLVLRIGGNKLKGAPPLEPPQRRPYFVVSVLLFGVWILLILLWIIRHFSAPAAILGGMAIMVLLAFCLWAYDSTLKHPTV